MQSLRPYFGQSAGFVFGATAIVTIGGITYVIKKRGKEDDPEADGDDNEPQPPFAQRFNQFVDSQIARTIPVEQRPVASIVTDPDSDAALNRLVDALHVFCEAGTGSGKTVLVTEIMRRVVAGGGKYFVLDGKPEGDWSKKWPGASKKIRNPELFVIALKAAQIDMERRIKHGMAKFPPYVLILDEASEITGKFEEAENAISDIARRGRSFGMRVWLLNQASTVMEVGFSGRAGILESNFTAIKLENEDGQRLLRFGKLRSGRVIPYQASYSIPQLPAPWANLDGLPEYNDSGEFDLHQPAVQLPLPAVQTPTQNGACTGANGHLPERVTASAPELVQVVQAESDKINSVARWMIETMTDESPHPIGARFLTVGEASAVFYLNQMEWTQNEIIEFVLGVKNAQRLAAVKGVLEKANV